MEKIGFFEWVSDNQKELDEKYDGELGTPEYFEWLESEYKKFNPTWGEADYILDRNK